MVQSCMQITVLGEEVIIFSTPGIFHHTHAAISEGAVQSDEFVPGCCSSRTLVTDFLDDGAQPSITDRCWHRVVRNIGNNLFSNSALG